MLQGKECGLVVKAKFIDKTFEHEGTDVMRLGNWFEYCATGSLPRDGKIPVPEYTNKGKPNQALKEPYQKAQQSAVLFNQIITNYGIEIVEKGFVVKTEDKEGIMDIIARWDNRLCIIDTKYSGLLEDKWNDMGWQIDSLPEKHDLLIQAVHYKIILAEKLSIGPDDIDFYFFVFDSQNPKLAKIIKVNVQEQTYEQHLKVIDIVKKKLELPQEQVFKPKPSLLLCSSCQLAPDCIHKVDLPQIQEIVY